MQRPMSVIEFKPKKKKISIEEILEYCEDEVFDQWAKAYKAGNLNSWFISNAQPWAAEGTHYVSDISALADLQAKLDMAFQLISPGIEFEAGKKLGGWICLFRVKDHLANTPPMLTEAHARSFAIVLHQKILRELLTV